MTDAPVFPPLMSGLPVAGAVDPFDAACAKAAMGCEAGLVVYNLGADRMGAALVLAPEVPLSQAVAMLPLCMVSFQNALGALAPPEVAVHLEWNGAIRINGARCGRFRAAASSAVPDVAPDWIVIGFELPLMLTMEPGDDPDQTALYEEGCVEVVPGQLVDAWARHTLHWIARWEDEGNRPLHAEWRGLAHGIGETAEQAGQTGSFLGVDEDFGMLLRRGTKTDVIPLTALLED